MNDILKVTITAISNADIAYCGTLWMGLPNVILRDLTEQGEVFMEILQRIIFPARLEEAMPSKCEVICMWYDRINRAPTYVTFDGEEYP